MQDTAGEAYVCWGMSLVSLPRESQYARHVRFGGLRLQSVRLWRKLGNHAQYDVSYDLLRGHILGTLNTPGYAARPEAILILHGFEEECNAWLDAHDALDCSESVIANRKVVACVAFALGHRAAAIEQLGHLVSEHGDRQLFNEHDRAAALCDAYLHLLRYCPNPPCSEATVRAELTSLIHHGGHRPANPLTLESAVKLASR